MSLNKAGVRVALVSVIMLAACDAAIPTESSPPPTAASVRARAATETGAERYVYEALHDLDGMEVSVECADGSVSESISLTGKIFERFTTVFSPNGGQHSVYHTMPVGLSGVGAVSGEEFRVSWRDHGAFNESPMSETSSFRYTMSFVGRTSKRSFELITQGHYTLNANGDPTVSREKLVAQCEA